MKTGRFASLLAISIGLVPSPEGLHGEEPVSLEMIRNLVNERQSTIKTLTVEWESKWYIPAGGLTKLYESLVRLEQLADDPKKAPQNVNVGTVPTETYEVTTKFRLVIEGQRIRYEYAHPNWSRESKEFFVKPYACVFSNGVATTLHANGGIANPNPSGGTQKATRHPDIAHGPLLPLMLTLFGTDATRQPYDLSAMKIIARQQKEQPNYLELSRLSGEKESVWLDPNRGFIPIRFFKSSESAVVLDIAIHQEPHPICKWIPKRWTVKTCAEDGTLMKLNSCEITLCRVNESVPEIEFHLNFPTDTLVVNAKDGPVTISIVNEDGTQSPLSQREIEMPIDELLDERHKKNSRKKWLRRSLYLGLVVASVGLWYIYRKWGRVKETGSS